MFVKIGATTLRQIRSALEKTAAFEKTAAELRHENDVYRRTLGLVARGCLDPEVALSKLAEFTADIDRLRVFELAMDNGTSDTIKLGMAVSADSGQSSGEVSPEEKYTSRLREATSEYGFN